AAPVRAGREGAAGAGDDGNAQIVVLDEGADGIAHLFAHPGVPRVHDVGPVEGQHADRAVPLELQEFVAHDRPPLVGNAQRRRAVPRPAAPRFALRRPAVPRFGIVALARLAVAFVVLAGPVRLAAARAGFLRTAFLPAEAVRAGRSGRSGLSESITPRFHSAQCKFWSAWRRIIWICGRSVPS